MTEICGMSIFHFIVFLLVVMGAILILEYFLVKKYGPYYFAEDFIKILREFKKEHVRKISEEVGCEERGCREVLETMSEVFFYLPFKIFLQRRLIYPLVVNMGTLRERCSFYIEKAPGMKEDFLRFFSTVEKTLYSPFPLEREEVQAYGDARKRIEDALPGILMSVGKRMKVKKSEDAGRDENSLHFMNELTEYYQKSYEGVWTERVEFDPDSHKEWERIMMKVRNAEGDVKGVYSSKYAMVYLSLLFSKLKSKGTAVSFEDVKETFDLSRKVSLHFGRGYLIPDDIKVAFRWKGRRWGKAAEDVLSVTPAANI
ncbi:MAG: hypothetical protein DRN35_04370 [Thermoplasmata archaeon]|nr:MAG: hypothetical protein DRN35_04370 [Thermoplasmata archaeon]